MSEARAAIVEAFQSGDWPRVIALAGACPRSRDDTQIQGLLGAALLRSGRAADAADAFARACALSPSDAIAHSNHGAVLKDLGRLDDAEAALLRALRLRSDLPEALSNLGATYHAAGRLEDAEACLRRALHAKPLFADAQENLGAVLADLGRYQEAEESLLLALRMAPDSFRGCNNLGRSLVGQRRFEEALHWLDKAIQLSPGYFPAWLNLAGVLRETGHLTAAAKAIERASALRPDSADAWRDLGLIASELGRIEVADAAFQRVLAIDPNDDTVRSHRLFLLSHRADVSPEDLCEAHREAGACYSRRAARWPAPVFGAAPAPGKPLRIGFVSGDLRAHVVASFFAPILTHLARDRGLSIHVYASCASQDHVSHGMRANVASWTVVDRDSDVDLVSRIRRDNIHILVDLSGHTKHNRLAAFAARAAPVQATWLGYPGTTGVPAVDYLISDRRGAPHGLLEKHVTEKLVRLPANGAFAPPHDAPPVNPLPATTNGFITFGSFFNRPYKLSWSVVDVWAQVLAGLPRSRLVLGGDLAADFASSLVVRLGQRGIDPARLTLLPTLSPRAYLEAHHGVDILLDTWPYAGCVTTNLGVWMGLPIVTLRGPSLAHCQGAAIMEALALGDWVADSVEEFVGIAIEKSAAPAALARLRDGMRDRWAQLPTRSPAVAAQGLALAFREMWRRVCVGAPADHFEIPPDALIGDMPPLLGVDFPASRE